MNDTLNLDLIMEIQSLDYIQYNYNYNFTNKWMDIKDSIIPICVCLSYVLMLQTNLYMDGFRWFDW